MKRWQIISLIFLAITAWTATAPVSADDKCYDDKGNPIPCPPTKEEPPPTKGGGGVATADKPTATLTPEPTHTLTPSPTWTASPLPVSTKTGTPSATLTQSVIIAASTVPPDEVYTPPPPRPCIPWLQIVLGGLGGLFIASGLTTGPGWTLFQSRGSPVRASASPPQTESSRPSHLRGRPLLTLPTVTSSVWFRVGIITIGIALSAGALTDLNSLTACNDWPAAGGISIGAGLLGSLLLSALRSRQRLNFPSDGTATGANLDEKEATTDYVDKA